MISLMSIFIFLILLVLVAVVVATVILASRKKTSIDNTSASEKPWPLGVNANFLTAAEKSFYGVLTQLIGNQYIICPKVSLSDVIFIQKGVDNSTRQSLFNRISRKHLDFVLLDLKTLEPVFAIELDDSSHQSMNAQQRDKVKDKALLDAGLKLIRVPAKHAYTVNDIKDVFSEDKLTQIDNSQPISAEGPEADINRDTNQASSSQMQVPTCPKCQVEMVKRKALKGKHAGRDFWGCPNYPHCREAIQFSDEQA